MLCPSSLGLTQCTTGSLYLSLPFTHFAHSPSPPPLWPARPGRCQMDKPALGHTDFGKVKSLLALGFWWGGVRGVGESPWGCPVPGEGTEKGQNEGWGTPRFYMTE